MLDILTNKHVMCDGLTRRHFLRIGVLGIGGLTLGDLLRLEAQAKIESGKLPSREKSMILLWQHGGPSHLETYDMKPDAPTEYRGPFRPIPTNVPGIQVCELLPMHAKIADKFTLIRSCSHGWGGHSDGMSMMMSGYPDWDDVLRRSAYPEVGAAVNRVFGQLHDGMPVAVGMGARHYGYVPSTSTGYWSDRFAPPTVDSGIRDTNLTIDGTRFNCRLELLENLDQFRADLVDGDAMDSMDEFQRQATEIIVGRKARDAFDLSLEDQQTRDRYGQGWGQKVLLGRRLVESGVRFVTVGVPGGKIIGNWDDHAVNGDIVSAMHERLPWFDQAVSALIEDIYQRGLDHDVMVMAMGEFGRTPRMNQSKGNSTGVMNWGRNHWPSAMSILVSGGGKRMGQVIGATNSKGEYPVERQLTPHDVLATIYQHLGIDHEQTFEDNSGRPIPLAKGTPIAEL